MFLKPKKKKNGAESLISSLMLPFDACQVTLGVNLGALINGDV